ncbi:xyloglucan galactosyltransferase MUR3 [Prunus yedoensis var. nudiflora]|uniref:Xyloglucan galactosyltransferase MUR3 n=1 Tax=Prunus yedoensis var. nudiflora TaxID=2094558 RepID=A0A314ZE09_PRUYE|nr:xyloglucan galactosyltransferase MUR3 [Prunus yedoensis var. nudiflora]
MRRRSPTSVPSEQMEKGTGKSQNTRICFLASLSVFFWMLLLYFHFVVLGGSTVDQSVKLQLQAGPVYTELKPTRVTSDPQIENQNTESKPIHVISDHQMDNQNTVSASTRGDHQVDNQNTESTPAVVAPAAHQRSPLQKPPRNMKRRNIRS